MKIYYPNGTPYSFNDEGKRHKKQGISSKKAIEFGKRGMNFEEEINQSNLYYINRQMAVIHKKPTPVQVVKVDYPKRSAATIKEAYFRQASTTDYNGVYQGLYIDFEAKETKNKTSFPLRNFHEHQIQHMDQCIQQKGICFVLIWFSSLSRCFLLGADFLICHWQNKETTGKKSIPLTLIEKEGYEISLGIAPRVPYLPAVDRYIRELSLNKGVSLDEQ